MHVVMQKKDEERGVESTNSEISAFRSKRMRDGHDLDPFNYALHWPPSVKAGALLFSFPPARRATACRPYI